MNSNAKILLVDDEVSIQRAVGPLLKSRGYDVEVAATGKTAIEAVGRPATRPGRSRSGPAGP